MLRSIIPSSLSAELLPQLQPSPPCPCRGTPRCFSPQTGTSLWQTPSRACTAVSNSYTTSPSFCSSGWGKAAPSQAHGVHVSVHSLTTRDIASQLPPFWVQFTVFNKNGPTRCCPEMSIRSAERAQCQQSLHVVTTPMVHFVSPEDSGSLFG